MTIETSETSDRAPVPSLPFNPAESVADEEFDDDAPANTPPPSSSALRDIEPSPPGDSRPIERGPAGDERPYLTGSTFLAALKYALVACPAPKKEDESSLLSYVVFHIDPARRRLSMTACDTTRYHQAFVAADASLAWMGSFRVSREDCQILRQLIETADKVGSYCCVRPVRRDAFGIEGWEISYGGAAPITTDAFVSLAHHNWEPPSFDSSRPPAVGAIHDARHVAKAMSISLESTRVARDEVDACGRRHVTLVDEFGSEVARAVLLNLGFTEGEPESPQRELPNTLGTPNRARTALPAEPLAQSRAATPKRATPVKSAAKSAKPVKATKAAKAKPAKAKKRR